MLALVAGEGALPGILLRQLRDAGTQVLLCELDGHPSEVQSDQPALTFRIETLGSFIAELKRLGVSDVCFAGRVARPKLDPSAIDVATMPLVPRMMAALQNGDDGALRVVLSFFEEAGIGVRAAHEISPDLMPEAGVLGEVQPAKQDRADALRGVEIIEAMAKVDVGQACIIARGQALAIEAIGGTDWMMRTLLMAADEPSTRHLLEGGILVKASKPGQDRRVDMPTIGPQTFERAAQVGLRGVVVEAGGVMVLDAAACIKSANAHGLFFWVRE